VFISNRRAADPFFHVSSEELAGVHLDLELLWGRSARELRERLCGAASPRHRFSILERALRAHLLRSFEQHYVVAAALHEVQQRKLRPMVREMAQKIGVSQRHLIQVFSAEVGLTPKLFSRILRFQRAALAATGATLDWSQISLDCGYCDQSHLIGDFVEFSGLTPAEYVQQLRYLDQHGFRRKRNHVPLVHAA
jgi:transcriptional regulator GlxA family with amidase domain